MKNRNIGILGYGEVGKAIASFYEAPFIQDPAQGKEFPKGQQLEILHVCIPFNKPVEAHIAVKAAIGIHAKAALVIVHSTVPVGTTQEIAEYHRHTVHSPVRGVHPNLADGIRTFPKFIGADFSGAGRLAAEHFEELGITSIVVHKSKTSELLKLLDTTYYGIAIAFHAYAKSLCEATGTSFDMVMTEANRTYNEGYTKLGKPNVVRPVLFPPEGKIGGHCVVPNAEILKGQFGDDAILEAILRHS